MATFRKRGKRWQAQVRRLGAFESASFDTKAAAEKWARRIEAEIDQGAALGRSRVTGTVNDLLAAYEREAKKVRPLGRSKLGVLKHLREGLGEIALRALTVDAILAHCRKRKAGRIIDGRQVSAGPVTIGLDLSLLGTVLRSAHALTGRRLSDDVVRQAREALRPTGMVGKSRERSRVASPAEIDQLCDYWEKNERQALPMAEFVRFAAITGMRREEIARLRWEDLDEKAGLILVRDRKDPRRKLGNDQRVPLLFGSLEIVQRQLRSGALIFPVRPDSVSTLFPRACKAVGIVGLRFHDLRHTAITRMFERKMSIEEVALISGHRSWAMLRRYTHLRPEDLAQRYASPDPPATRTDSTGDTSLSDQH